MIDSNLGKTAFKIGFFLAFGGGILSILTQPGTPERIVSQLIFGIGLVFVIMVVVLIRIRPRK